jgi:formiminotetrahydrofolate cyclodeaminase
LRALELVESVKVLVQRNIRSDLLAGADILHGATLAVLRTVEINLPALGDASLRESLTRQVEQVERAAAASYARICASP